MRTERLKKTPLDASNLWMCNQVIWNHLCVFHLNDTFLHLDTVYLNILFSNGVGTGNPLQDSCLEIFMDRGAQRATVHGVAELDTTKWLRAHTHVYTLSYTIHFFYPCTRAGERLGCFHSWAIMNNAVWTLVYKSSQGHMFSFPLGVYLGVGLLGPMITLFLTICGVRDSSPKHGKVLQSHQHCMRPRVVLAGWIEIIFIKHLVWCLASSREKNNSSLLPFSNMSGSWTPPTSPNTSPKSPLWISTWIQSQAPCFNLYLIYTVVVSPPKFAPGTHGVF